LPSSFCMPATSEPISVSFCHIQSRWSTRRVETPCSQTVALTAGTKAAPFSTCIFVAHCESSTTAQFLVAASFCREFIINCNTCSRFAGMLSPVRVRLVRIAWPQLCVRHLPLLPRACVLPSCVLGSVEFSRALAMLITTSETSGENESLVGRDTSAMR
jgi:hypothetical protein